VSWRQFCRCPLQVTVVVTVLVCAMNPAAAQTPPDRDHGGAAPGLRPAVPGQTVRPPATPATPVIPDTVSIRITVPDSLPQPRAVHVVQDTLEFGGLLHLVLDYAPEQIEGPQLNPMAEGEWLVPYTASPPGFMTRLLGSSPELEIDLSQLPELPPDEGLRVVRTFRVYRRDPFRISWQEQLSRVLVVRGQTDGSEQTATIRGPRSLAWTPWRLVLLAVILVLLAWLARRLWRRRHRPVPLENWLLPEPAWLATAIGLQGLLAENILDRGDTRLFLDRLAYLARDYVAGRYRIPAREMTGGEIVAACTALGHEPGHPLGFGRLIDLADHERYNPEAPAAGFCREQSVQLLGRIGRVRLQWRHIAVAAERQLTADKAWSALTDELGTGAGRAVGSAAGREVR